MQHGGGRSSEWRVILFIMVFREVENAARWRGTEAVGCAKCVAHIVVYATFEKVSLRRHFLFHRVVGVKVVRV